MRRTRTAMLSAMVESERMAWNASALRTCARGTQADASTQGKGARQRTEHVQRCTARGETCVNARWAWR